MVQPFIDMVCKDSNGRIKIIWLGGPEVVQSFTKAEAVKRGTIDIDLFNSFGFYRSLMPVGLAKGLSTYSPSEERANGLYDLWDKNFQRSGRGSRRLGAAVLSATRRVPASLGPSLGPTRSTARLRTVVAAGDVRSPMPSSDLYSRRSLGKVT